MTTPTYLSGAYTLQPSDNGALLVATGNAQYTLTVQAAAVYPDGFTATLLNADLRGKTISGVGSNFILWPSQQLNVWVLNGAVYINPPKQRWASPATGAVFYVSPAGNDASDGLVSSAPLAKIQTAIKLCQTAVDPNGAVPTVQLLDGTFEEAVSVAGAMWGGVDQISIVGNQSNPLAVWWRNADPAIPQSLNALSVQDEAIITVRGVFLQAFAPPGGSAGCIATRQGAVCDFGNCYFDQAFNGVHLAPGEISKINAIDDYFIYNGAEYHINAGAGGQFNAAGVTAHMPNAVNFSSGCMEAAGPGATIRCPTFSGAGVAGTTGPQGYVADNAVIYTSGIVPGSPGIVPSYGGIVH